MAVAPQITSPPPLLVQDGSELTVPVRVIQVPHFVPLNTFTMSWEPPLRTAQATSSVEAKAQDGLPIAVAAPVETKLPQVAEARGTQPRHKGRSNIQVKRRFIGILAA